MRPTSRGDEVVLLDPLHDHVLRAVERAQARFSSLVGEARRLPVDDASIDVVLLMGPLYHLIERPDRLAALGEAQRVLRAGGLVLAEVIARHAWVLVASAREQLDRPEHQVPDLMEDGAFWAYFHRPDELVAELTGAGFVEPELVAVESFGWVLGDLERRMQDPAPLLRALRLTESEPSMLGVSGHILGIGRRPAR